METWGDWIKAWVENLGLHLHEGLRDSRRAGPYKLDFAYRFTFLPDHISSMGRETTGRVIGATERELVLAIEDTDRIWPLIVGRSSVKTAIEVDLEEKYIAELVDRKLAERRKAKEQAPEVPK